MRELPVLRRFAIRVALYGVAVALPVGGVLTAGWPAPFSVLVVGALMSAMVLERELDRVSPPLQGCSFCQAPGAVFARAYNEEAPPDVRMLVSGTHTAICERCLTLAKAMLDQPRHAVGPGGPNPFEAPHQAGERLANVSSTGPWEQPPEA